jgi:hypothetical protein
MNNLMHPDTFFEHNRQYQKERLEESQQIRPFLTPTSTNSTLKDQVFLMAGDLFITFGKNLKSRATRPVCEPQAA